jgi:glucose-1-phosphate adenylyltransferase
MISEGCILNGVYARSSIIGLRSRIDAGTRIENSIVMGSDFYESLEEIGSDLDAKTPHIGIGPNCLIRGAIIDKNVRIGRNVQLLNSASVENMDDPNGCFHIRDRIIIVPKNSVIPDGTSV